LGVLILVHVLEDLVHSLKTTNCHQGRFSSVPYILGCGKRDSDGSDLFGGILVFWMLDHLISHLVDGADDLEHLGVGDRPVAVDVIQLEGPWKNTDEQGYLSTT